jgi:hypothetical protein
VSACLAALMPATAVFFQNVAVATHLDGDEVGFMSHCRNPCGMASTVGAVALQEWCVCSHQLHQKDTSTILLIVPHKVSAAAILQLSVTRVLNGDVVFLGSNAGTFQQPAARAVWAGWDNSKPPTVDATA